MGRRRDARPDHRGPAEGAVVCWRCRSPARGPYPQFVAELREASGLDPGYLGCGTLVVARDRDEAEALERELEMRARLGLPVRRLRPSEARRLEPALAPTVRLALDVPDDHAIDPRALVAALGCGG